MLTLKDRVITLSTCNALQYSPLQWNVVIRESFIFRYSVVPYLGFYCVPICSVLGVPFESFKVVSLVTYLTFRGINIDTIALHIYLPEDKIINWEENFARWYPKEWSQRKLSHPLYVGFNLHSELYTLGVQFSRDCMLFRKWTLTLCIT